MLFIPGDQYKQVRVKHHIKDGMPVANSGHLT
jgi:hypothetical protein